MTLVLDAEDVESLADMSALIGAMEEGLREESQGTTEVPPRLNMSASGRFFRLMPAMIPGRNLMGFKAFNGSAQAGVRYVIAIYDEKEGELLSLLEAGYLTAARTGATTGLATRLLAPPDAEVVAVIGSGLEARTNLLGVCAVRPVKRVRVFSPTPAKREAFARDMQEQLGVEVRAIGEPQACVQGAQIVVVATNTGGRYDVIAFRGAWMSPGTHVNSIGSTMPSLRELDTEAFGQADHVVLDTAHQAESESGDLLAAIEAGSYAREKVFELTDVLSEDASGRVSPDELTLFKSVGTAVQDVMAGYTIYQEALQQGRGRNVDFLELKTF